MKDKTYTVLKARGENHNASSIIDFIRITQNCFIIAARLLIDCTLKHAVQGNTKTQGSIKDFIKSLCPKEFAENA